MDQLIEISASSVIQVKQIGREKNRLRPATLGKARLKILVDVLWILVGDCRTLESDGRVT